MNSQWRKKVISASLILLLFLCPLFLVQPSYGANINDSSTSSSSLANSSSNLLSSIDSFSTNSIDSDSSNSIESSTTNSEKEISDSTSSAYSATEESSSSTDSSVSVEPELYDTRADGVVVSSFNELKSVLINPPTVTTIFLSKDIQMESGGIAINSNWTELTIDGKDPYTGVTHKLIDYVSASYYNTIHPTSSVLESITLQNLILDGKNYYGPVGIYDGYRDVTITYNNVDYTGPQLTYNSNGTAKYIDCNITITTNNGASNAQEIGEVSNVEIGGNTTITSTSTSDSLFWFKSSGGLLQFWMVQLS